MSEEKKVESTTEVKSEGGSSANLIQDPLPVEDNPTIVKEKSGFQGAATDEVKGIKSQLETNYEELEKKLGTQGQELGDYRNFFKEISPLLDKLDKQPELVQAIIDGKVDASLAKSAIEGKISIADAKSVTKAHEEIKKELGKKEYKELKPEEIEQKITEKLSADVKKMGEEITKKVQKTTSEADEIRDYKASIDKFITETKDFPVYAERINKWIDEHPEQDDIKIAYDVIKGQVLQEKEKENKEIDQGEAAKMIAANAAGGGSQGGTIVSDKKVIDELIGDNSNPNAF